MRGEGLSVEPIATPGQMEPVDPFHPHVDQTGEFFIHLVLSLSLCTSIARGASIALDADDPGAAGVGYDRGQLQGFFVPCLDILWKNDGSLLSYVWIR